MRAPTRSLVFLACSCVLSLACKLGDDVRYESDGKVVLAGGVLTLPPGYNRNEPPRGEVTYNRFEEPKADKMTHKRQRLDDPGKISIAFLVSDIMEVDDTDYTISMRLEVPIFWNDSRVEIDSARMDALAPGRWFSLDPQWKDELW